MFRKVLVPTDGSELAEQAIARVGPLVAPGGEALVVEVVDTIEHILMQTTPAGFDLAPGYLSTDILEEIVREQRVEAEEHLAAARRALEAAGVGTVETRVLEGVPGPELVALAHAERCDAVVMATHGRSGLRRAMLGSVADHVVRHLKGVPVVLLHPDGEEAEERAPVAAAART
jgi:nucleotide-binding universal stress UspA family protein